MLNLNVLKWCPIHVFKTYLKHLNFVATTTNTIALVKGVYRRPIISVLGLYGSRNTHCPHTHADLKDPTYWQKTGRKSSKYSRRFWRYAGSICGNNMQAIIQYITVCWYQTIYSLNFEKVNTGKLRFLFSIIGGGGGENYGIFCSLFLGKKLKDCWSVQSMKPFVHMFKFVVSQKSTEAFS